MADNGARIGDNSQLKADDKIRLSGFISEIERIEGEKRILAEDLTEIYKSAKDAGFNTKAMRHTVKMRRMEKDERSAFENACDAYAHALGDFITTPLGQAGLPNQTGA